MNTIYSINCAKYPSDSKCDLQISGTNREAVIDAAFYHAVGPLHNHRIDEPGLREKIGEIIETRTDGSLSFEEESRFGAPV